MVEGFVINQSSIPSITCEACIQAKQSRKPYPIEAKNRSKFLGKGLCQMYRDLPELNQLENGDGIFHLLMIAPGTAT